MKKIFILLVALVPVLLHGYGPENSVFIEEVFSQNTSIGASDSVVFKSEAFKAFGDTLGFVIEKVSSDSTRSYSQIVIDGDTTTVNAKTDSLDIKVYYRPLSPEGNPDTTALGNLPNVVSKASNLTGPVFGAPVTGLKTTQNHYGRIEVQVMNKNASKQNYKLRIYSIRKYMRRP